MLSAKTTVSVVTITGKERARKEDVVVREAPVTIHLNDAELVTLLCTPTHLHELSLGFLFAEGLITSAADVTGYAASKADGLVWVEACPRREVKNSFLKRRISSCCGRGSASFYFVNDREIKPVSSGRPIPARTVMALRGEAESRGSLFAATGGAHGAALGDQHGLQCFFEDVGRHNAVDKVAGWCLLQGVHPHDGVLLLSGRVSAEIVVKTARLGIPVIVSRSAPTDLALRLAEELNITVVGFARGSRMNVYTGAERIT